MGKTAKAESAKTADSATTAGSATKATQDGSGNNIEQTYATNIALQEVASGALPKGVISYGTVDLEDGVSPLETGKLYIVYEE